MLGRCGPLQLLVPPDSGGPPSDFQGVTRPGTGDPLYRTSCGAPLLRDSFRNALLDQVSSQLFQWWRQLTDCGAVGSGMDQLEQGAGHTFQAIHIRHKRAAI
jgi:hypothetical protein